MKHISGTWQNLDGIPVANGRVFFRLSQDAVASGAAQVSTALISFTLDSTGSLPAGTQIWANDELSPSGTTYSVAVLNTGGGLVWGAEQLSLTGSSPININNITPNSQGVIFANPVLQNPTQAQSITGFGLTLTSSAPLTLQGNLTATLGQNILNAYNLNNIVFVDGIKYTTLAAAYAALPSSGGIIIVPPGTYTGSLTLVGGKPVYLLGSGRGATTLIPSASNTPVIQMPQSGGQADDCYMAGFSVKAHASGSTGTAIDLNGTRNSIFEHIEYLSNAAANFNSFFHLSANNLCYGNKIRHARVDTQSGPTTVFLFDNNGTANTAFNANNNYIEAPWINTNTGITTIIDARRSVNVSITGGLFENNTGAVVLIPGTATALRDSFMESNAATSVVGTAGADGASNGVVLENNYISTNQTWTIQASSDNWDIKDNYEAGTLTVTDNSGGGTTNLIQRGMTVRGTQNDLAWQINNTAVNGINWGLVSATGAGAVPYNGGFAIKDLTNGKISAAFNPNNGDIVFSDFGGNVMKINAGVITTYKNIATVSNGVPSILAQINSTGLTGNVAAATLYPVPASGEGLYEVSSYVVLTVAGSVSSTLPNVQLVYTDKDSNTSVTLDATPILAVAGIGQTGVLTANTVGTVASGTVPIYVKASTTIQYQTVNYASNAAGMTYALRIRLKAL